MIKAFAILFVAALTSMAETYIVPSANGVVGVGLSMPKSEWTNCVFWMDASFPVSGEGTTNYAIPDLSPARNDAAQPATNSQPARVYTNGAWAYQFDGVNDLAGLFRGLDVDPTNHTCIIKFRVLGNFGVRQFAINYGPSSSHRFVVGTQNGGYYYATHYDGVFTSALSGWNAVNADWVTMALVMTGTDLVAYLNSEPMSASTSSCACGYGLTLGAYSNGNSPLTGGIAFACIINRALTAAEVAALNN